MEELPDSQEGLEAMLESLSLELEKFQKQKKEVLSALSKKDEPTAEQPTKEDIIVVFVEEIEKAHQYYEFKDYLRENNVVKPKHDAVKSLKYLVKELKIQKDLRFNKLDFKLIMDAVQGYILNRERRDCHKEAIQGNTSCEVSSEEGNDWYSLMSDKKRTLAGLIDPILELVYHIREKGHVMNENPLVELEYIKKFDPLFYKHCFVRELLQKRSERAVMVLFVPLHFMHNDMKHALSVCGKAVSVKFERHGPRGSTKVAHKVAHVTFENSVAAKLAPVIMDRTTSFSIQPVFEECEYKPKLVTEYEEALIKYGEFRNYSKKSQIEPVSQKMSPSTQIEPASQKMSPSRRRRRRRR